MGYLFAKALHMVGFVSWFAGLFYIVRLFIYHVEAAARPEPERSLLHAQFTLMERRLWLAITVPAMVITVVFGGWLGYTYLSAVPLATGAWLLVKLGLVALLLAYHLLCGSHPQATGRRHVQVDVARSCGCGTSWRRCCWWPS